jgi:rhodanese-related sulfurtransferase
MSEYVAPGYLRRRQLVGSVPTVVDVRDADEYAPGHLPGARHIPLAELPNRLGELPRDRPVVTY